MRKAARAADKQRQASSNHRVRRQAEAQRLRKHEPQDAAGLGVFGQNLPGRAIDQAVEIGEPAQRFLRDGKREGAVIAALDRAQYRRGGLIERIATAQHGIEQAQRSAASRDAGKVIAGIRGMGSTGHW
ncbi:hypothetical protein NSE01_40010 [Novosphingobium sediminis]|uniref:Uncharacterized protein n=1 Tax=Novosphingobium sediminis TaxID=707214 RepID=A0A512AR23_9SPHN|nr:hypothetical protein NSE01_40010 [Novosphingobium sediminis]